MFLDLFFEFGIYFEHLSTRFVYYGWPQHDSYDGWMKPYHTGVVSFVSVSEVQKSEALMLMILWLDVFYSANKVEGFWKTCYWCRWFCQIWSSSRSKFLDLRGVTHHTNNNNYDHNIIQKAKVSGEEITFPYLFYLWIIIFVFVAFVYFLLLFFVFLFLLTGITFVFFYSIVFLLILFF